jgi:hypothetical protein
LRRGEFTMFFKISQLNYPLEKKNPSKYTPTTNSYDFTGRSALKIYNKIIYKVRKTTLEPSV